MFLLHFKIRFMIMSTKREVFVSKKWHEEILLTEVSTVSLYKFKVGSKERGKAWREVSVNLNTLNDLGFKITPRYDPNQSQLSSSKAVHFCYRTHLDAKSPSSNSPILNLVILVAKCNVLTCSLLNTPNKILKKTAYTLRVTPFYTIVSYHVSYPYLGTTLQ